MLDAGIRTFINLTEELEEGRYDFEPYEEDIRMLAAERGLTVECLHFPIVDRSLPSAAAMTLILDVIDDALSHGTPAYVHCIAGRGRTGTVVGCWLARHGKATGARALSFIQELRKNDPTRIFPSPETEPQRQMVKRWKRGQ